MLVILFDSDSVSKMYISHMNFCIYNFFNNSRQDERKSPCARKKGE